MVIVPLRSPEVFTSATNSALPSPTASALTIRTHGSALAALHRHPVSVETETLKGPPADDIWVEALPSSKRHGAACCETGTLLPFITRTADRSIPAGFAATTTLIDASPCPAPGVTCTHDESLSIAHEHSRLAETLAARRVADAGRDAGSPANEGSHFAVPLGAAISVMLLSLHPAAMMARAIEIGKRRPHPMTSTREYRDGQLGGGSYNEMQRCVIDARRRVDTNHAGGALGMCGHETASSSSEQRGTGGRMNVKGKVKRIVGMSVFALVLSGVAMSAAPRIDIEPEECQTRCFFFMGVPIYCYEICY